jgi:pyruvate formate-lyase/glycerol dehydratase family glycyl radical enzyme
MNFITSLLLKTMAFMFNTRPSLKKYLRTTDGWINFSVGIKLENGKLEQSITFRNGKASVSGKIEPDTDVVMRFVNKETVKEMLKITPNEILGLILHNKMVLEGNIAYLQLFNFYLSLLLGKKHQRMLAKRIKEDSTYRKKEYDAGGHEARCREIADRNKNRLRGMRTDENVRYLEDPYLSEYSIDNFPRIKQFLNDHFTLKPAICTERPRLLTQWFRKNGFESDTEGILWQPEIRTALAYRYLMENRKPIIHGNDLIAGTSTSKEPTGVIIYPDAQGTMIWGELGSVDKRVLNPYTISEKDALVLHDIFTFWTKRNFREYVRDKYHNPLCLSIDERWVYYFVWKSVGISHTIPDFPKVLNKGLNGIMEEIDARLKDEKNTEANIISLTAMNITLEGVIAYAKNLAGEATVLASSEHNPVRKKELERLAGICAKVPAGPSETLDEALNALWIVWVALHMENTNTGLSIGRLDQWLQPYFAKDMEKISTEAERRDYIAHAIELVACFFMRGTDHLPLVPDIGNYLFGGSSSDQAITLGGVTPDGKDGVNDMTYIILKVTEMLSIRDPNVNARFSMEKNSDTYLKRLCEVNYITVATPSMHSDENVTTSLAPHGYKTEDVRDWAATGCVEPTLCGRHMGHTGSILMNMVAALEMALNNGRHPSMDWNLGPSTGSIEKGSFTTFEEFYSAYTVQQKFLIDRAVELNNMLAEAHTVLRPTPLLSSLIDGSIEKGIDVTKGGARYNTSGSSNIGLVDVTDSLMVIKKLVFDDKIISFAELKKAVDANFTGDPKILALVQSRVPLFGSGNSESLALANRITEFIHGCYHHRTNYRGGKYTAGFWSMSQHVAYGSLSGALPSGRRAGKAFTPGLTPQPSASKSFLDNITDVARLNPQHMDNNIAFNVKLMPGLAGKREDTIDAMRSYVKTYFQQGGMQMQFNVVTSEVLKDAMAHPENYRNLLVRISGYNAYFVTLNREMQIELIERTGYGI